MRKDNYSIQKPAVPTVSHIGVLAVEDYISSHNVNQLSEAEIASGALESINNRIDVENGARNKEEQISKQKDMSTMNIAQLMSVRDDLVLVAPMSKLETDHEDEYTADDVEDFPFGIYQKEKRKMGTYVLTNSDKGGLAEIVRLYKPNANRKDIGEVTDLLRGMLKVVTPNTDPKLVPVNNGVWDMDKKILNQYSPNYVFTSKIRTDLNINATNPVFDIAEDGTQWDVRSWLSSLGSKEFVDSIWEVLQASVLVNAPFNQMVLMTNKSGCNGKSTLITLLRNLLGNDVTASIPMHKFSERFGLSILPGAIGVLCDENPVGMFYKDLSNLKACISSDPILIEQKYKNSYDFVFHGLVVQAVNDTTIRVEDKSGSWKRRLFILPFNQNFFGAERKYIKERLVHEKSVLEYILKVILVDMPYRESFTETELTKSALAEYSIASNSVVAFLEEILPRCTYNLLPCTAYLYEGYKQWLRIYSPSGRSLNRNDFLSEVREYANTSLRDNPNFEWEWTDSTRTQGYIDFSYDPVADEYNIEPFKSIAYWYTHKSILDTDKLSKNYSGLKRRNFALSKGTDTDKEEPQED